MTKSKAGQASRGFCGIGIYNPKHAINVGGLYRHAFVFGASFAFTIGSRYRREAADTPSAAKHMPIYEYQTETDLFENLPVGCELCAVELDDSAGDLPSFEHPERCVYILGAEDSGLPRSIIDACSHVVRIDTTYSMNVATTAGIVLYDRQSKAVRRGE